MHFFLSFWPVRQENGIADKEVYAKWYSFLFFPFLLFLSFSPHSFLLPSRVFSLFLFSSLFPFLEVPSFFLFDFQCFFEWIPPLLTPLASPFAPLLLSRSPSFPSSSLGSLCYL